ncbi:MAG: PIN domain-containing protein [Gemmatimonadota bacterium]
MILLDTDVLIDVALDRTPHVEASGALLRWLEAQPPLAFVAWHTLANLSYLLRPRVGRDGVRHFLSELTRFVTVAPTHTDAFRYAAVLPMADFEDALQVAAADACGARVIATRNTQDFVHSPVPARTPAQLLVELRSHQR